MRSTVLPVVFAAVAAAPSAARAKPPLLFVSAEAGGEIVVVDPVKAQPVEHIKVGARPRGIKLSKDGRSLFVAVAGPAKAAPRPGLAPAPAPPAEQAPGLAVVDVTARKVTKRVATPAAPFAVFPSGERSTGRRRTCRTAPRTRSSPSTSARDRSSRRPESAPSPRASRSAPTARSSSSRRTAPMRSPRSTRRR